MLTKLSTFRGVTDDGEPLVRLFHPGDNIKKIAGAFMPEVQEWLGGYSPIKDKIALLVNALGASEYWGQNNNGDVFPWSAISYDLRGHPKFPPIDDFTGRPVPPYGYRTFLDAHPFVHHRNKDPSIAFGKVVLTCLNAKMKRVELIVLLDRELAIRHGAQSVVERVDAGEYPDVSMGCRVPYDVCTICGHKSKTRNDYCKCIKELGMNKLLPDGRRVGVINLHPRFFDISFVFIGADKTAKVMNKLASADSWIPESVLEGERIYGVQEEGLVKAAGFRNVYENTERLIIPKQVHPVDPEVDRNLDLEEKFHSLGYGHRLHKHNVPEKDLLTHPEVQNFARRHNAQFDWIRPGASPGQYKFGLAPVKTAGFTSNAVVRIEAARDRGKEITPQVVIGKDAWSRIKSLFKDKKAGLYYVSDKNLNKPRAVMTDEPSGPKDGVLRTNISDSEVPSNVTGGNITKTSADPLEDLFLGGDIAKRRMRTWKNLETGAETTHKGSGLGTSFDNMQKTASMKSAGTKKASHAKIADIEKEIEPSGTVGRVSAALTDREPDIPPSILEMMARCKLREALATPSMMGMSLKPEEFQKLLLSHIGRSDVAEDLERNGETFPEVEEVEAPCESLSKGDFNPEIMDSLLPFLKERSFLSPVVVRRITVISVRPKQPGAIPTENPLLSKIGAAYNWYRREMTKVAASYAPSAVLDHPKLMAGVFNITDGDVFQKEANGRGDVLSAYSLALMYSSTLRKEAKQKPGFLTRVIDDHPYLTTSGTEKLARQVKAITTVQKLGIDARLA